jgi:hypothetical protein
MWCLGALLICGGLAIYLWRWQRERRLYWAWWKKYFAESRQLNEEFTRKHDELARKIHDELARKI